MLTKMKNKFYKIESSVCGPTLSQGQLTDLKPLVIMVADWKA